MHLRHINNSDVPLHCFEGGKGETRIRERSMRLLDQTWRTGRRVRGVEIRRRQMVTGRGARPVGGGATAACGGGGRKEQRPFRKPRRCLNDVRVPETNPKVEFKSASDALLIKY